MRHVGLALVLCVGMWGGAAGIANAQDYPSKVVRLIVPFAPGGSADTVARILAQKLSEIWTQTVIVDNRVGASGTIGAIFVAKAPPDGYTLLLGDGSTNVTAKSINPQLPYDPLSDFVDVARLVMFPQVLVVPAGSSITTLNELIAQAKAKPGTLRFSSAGVGSLPHMSVELMNQLASVSTQAIHYKGSAPSLTGLLAGDADYSMMSIGTSQAQIKAGKVRALGVTSASPYHRLPNVPTIASAVPGYESYQFLGLHAPAKTPMPIVAKLNQEVVRVMRRPEVSERIEGQAMDVAVGTAEEFSAFIRQQTDLWAKVIRTGNIRAE